MKLEFLEIDSCGIYDSFLEYGNIPVSPPRTTTMFEIEIPLEKSGIVHIDDDDIALTPDIIICAKPGQVRSSNLPFKCFYIQFSLAEGELYSKLSSLPNSIKPLNSEKYYTYFRSINKYITSNDKYSDVIIFNVFFEFLHTLLSDANKRPRKSTKIDNHNHEVVQIAKNYITDNLSFELSLEKIATQVKYSPAHFHQIFKNITGTTLHKYIENLRIEKAIALLTETDYNLSQIASLCGFSSQSYFNYAFKRKTNTTPKKYASEMIRNFTKRY